MSLSICCATANPSRAAAVLGTLREVADEIVVAVDVTGGERDLAPLGAVADRLFEVELDTFVESTMAWLHERCSGDWILRVDDDEVPSASLLEQLPELTRARDVVQYWLTRRWLYPDPGHWLEEWPWFPDFQGQLVRNDAQLWFPGLRHSGVALARPARYLECGLYHFAHLLGDRGAREREGERLPAAETAPRENSTDLYLADCFIPERRPPIERVETEVDVRDRAAVALTLRRLLDRDVDRLEIATSLGDEVGSSGRPVRPRRVPRAEVRAHWAARDLTEGAYRARIEPVDLYNRLVGGDCRPFRVRVHNDGDERWPGGEDRRPLIRMAYRWLTAGGEVFEAEGERTPLPNPLAPGEACIVAMNVIAPATAGRYVLAPDLVHEYVRWFECESRPVEMLVTDPGAVSPVSTRRGAVAEPALGKAAPMEAAP